MVLREVAHGREIWLCAYIRIKDMNIGLIDVDKGNNDPSVQIEWHYGKRPYCKYDRTLKKEVNELRDARWFYRNGKEVVCFKHDGNMNVYDGDIVKDYLRDHEYVINDKEFYCKLLDSWTDMGYFVIQPPCMSCSNTEECRHYLIGNIFEHPHLLPQLLDKEYYVDGIIWMPGSPRYLGSREDYYAYIQSNKWKRTKAKRIKTDGCRCAVCGKHNVALHVHHLSYGRFGNENESDIITLCPDCHESIHSDSDDFYLALAKESPEDRILGDSERLVIRLFASMFKDKNMRYKQILLASIMGISLAPDFKRERDLLAVMDMWGKGGHIEFDVRYDNESELRRVLAIADTLGYSWFDTSNETATYGIGEAIDCADGILNFSGDLVVWGNRSKHEIHALDFIALFQD